MSDAYCPSCGQQWPHDGHDCTDSLFDFDMSAVRATKDDAWRYHIRLPHQCDTWDIVGEEYKQEERGLPRDLAILRMERFISEAQVILDMLRSETP